MSEPMRAMAEAALFPLDGELAVSGLGKAVTVERDAYGVPRITAASLDDLWFAQGFVTAGERLFQLELALRLATGRLSEIFSELTYSDDVFMRTIGLNRAGAAHVEEWTDLDHAMHARFRAGVRAWIEAMPAKPVEYQLLDLEPAIPDDPAPYGAAIALLAWNLSSNWDAELLRAELDDRIHHATTDLFCPRRLAAELARTTGPSPAAAPRAGSRCSRGIRICWSPNRARGSSCTCAPRATTRAGSRSPSCPASSSARRPTTRGPRPT